MYTPDKIETLKENEIFIFGSNIQWHHFGWAAKLALEKFWAIIWIWEWLQWQCYAFPTLDKNMNKCSKREIIISFRKLYECAKNKNNNIFYLTKIWCGIAWFTEEEIKAYIPVKRPKNILFPKWR